jgi:diphthamide synthase (EF-2-diphthine--ammonia ligase)
VPQDVLVAWSGGKDSALALREILGDARYRVAALLTTVTAEYDRISMHGVRRTLLRRQAEALGLPLEEVVISPGASNDEYEAEFDAELLRDLPPEVDPCGENGEFHTFVYAGPGLRQPVCHQRGAVVVRDGRFVYCDLVETASR